MGVPIWQFVFGTEMFTDLADARLQYVTEEKADRVRASLASVLG